jgi:hypothetical protein
MNLKRLPIKGIKDVDIAVGLDNKITLTFISGGATTCICGVNMGEYAIEMNDERTRIVIDLNDDEYDIRNDVAERLKVLFQL